jgi:hypothetical protein
MQRERVPGQAALVRDARVTPEEVAPASTVREPILVRPPPDARLRVDWGAAHRQRRVAPERPALPEDVS